MKIEMDLKRIKKLAAALDDENWEFRTFLKGLDLDSAELDAIVHRINDEVSAQIDCTQCANCCKVVSPVLDEADIARFAAGLDRPVPEFTEIYLVLDEDEPGKHMFNRQPCPFLKNDQCSNYEHRPHDCTSFPHLHLAGFRSRLYGVLENYEICPIVFNVYERLKVEVWYDDDFDEGGF